MLPYYAIAFLVGLVAALALGIKRLVAERNLARWQANHWRTGYYELVESRVTFYNSVISKLRGERQDWWN